MKKKCNVTTITPVYNTEDYLHRCIKSIINQKGVTIEIILIDDGSTDNSSAILDYYQQKDKRIKIIKKCNEGQGKARNLGIKIATGEYVYFIDSDDHLGENTLEKLYSTSIKNKLDLCSPRVPEHYFEKPLEQIPCLPCKSQFIKLEIIKKYNIYQPDIRSGQDGVFSNLLLAHSQRIGVNNEAIFHYTHAREGSTFKKYLSRPYDLQSIITKHLDYINQHYDENNLWELNALRFFGFIESETIRNRLQPHIDKIEENTKINIYKLICKYTKKAFKYLDDDEKNLLTSSLKLFVFRDANYILHNDKILNSSERIKSLSINQNFQKGNIKICKISNQKYIFNDNNKDKKTDSNEGEINNIKTKSKIDIDDLNTKMKLTISKIDYAINTLNNSNIQIKSSIMNIREKQLVNSSSNIIVSLTTLSQRLSTVHFAIESILSQTIRPKKIVLWIDKNIEIRKYITKEISNLIERGLEVKYIKDLGPHTKLIYALNEYPNNPIVTIDDDIIYPINMLEKLIEIHREKPKAIISNWAREITFDTNGNVRGVRKGMLLTPPLQESIIEQPNKYIPKESILAFAYGTSGVLYPPNSFDNNVNNTKLFSELCPREDDIWFKAMSLLKGTPVATTNLGINPSHYCITGSQSYALRHYNHGEGENEIQMQKVFNYFGLNKNSIYNRFNK